MIDVFTLHTTGKTYEDRKESVRDVAMASQSGGTAGMTWGELAILGDWLDRMAHKYGLCAEFAENGVLQ